MEEEQIKFIRDELGENKDKTELFLKDFILDSEDILAVYDYYSKKRGETPRNYYFDSVAYILTDKRILILKIKKATCFLKFLALDDVCGLEIDRDNKFLGETNVLKDSDLLKTILICFKNDDDSNDDDNKIEFKDNTTCSKSIQKEKAFKFLKALNNILYS